MHQSAGTNISSFFLAGINYKKSDATVRGRFAINDDRYECIINAAPSFGITELFVLSTCNRTEIYGFARDAADLCSLLCDQTDGSLQDFLKVAYIKSGVNAMEHLFNVAAGLDSQILGDYEIVGQIKQTAKFSRQRNFIGAYLDRMINEVLQVSKKVRTNTAMSGGTVSVSYAAVQFIREKINIDSGKKILLLGTGKIGTNTCKNLADYLPGMPVTLINRNAEKAKELAAHYQFAYDYIENLQDRINDADIILVATNAAEPIIHATHFSGLSKKLIIDLSVPCNVATGVKKLNNVESIDIDELSRIKDETLQKRSAEIPKVKTIIEQHIHEFMEWHEMRRHVPMLKNVKDKLLMMQSGSIPSLQETPAAIVWKNKNAEDKIQKVINGMAVKMRIRNQPGCHYIEAINDFISTGPLQ